MRRIHQGAVYAAAKDDVDAALAFLVQAGTQIVDGKEFDGTQIAKLDSWLVSESQRTREIVGCVCGSGSY